MALRKGAVWIGYTVGWIVLGGLAAYTAWQAHVTTLAYAMLLINHPTWRPAGWNSGTLIGISKLSVIAWGSLWLVAIYYIEYQLRESIQERRLIKQLTYFAGRLLIALAAIYALGLFQ
jgi:hypothetical protein